MNGALLIANGAIYENIALGWLQDRGIPARRVGEWKAHDLEVGPVRIEVKGSLLQALGKRTRGYQFCLHRFGKGPHAESDYHLLLCVVSATEVHAFVIPSRELEGASHVSIPNPTPAAYGGRWAKYFERTDVIEQGACVHPNPVYDRCTTQP